jgi:tetratricopeptide (TPR) repeat protein
MKTASLFACLALTATAVPAWAEAPAQARPGTDLLAVSRAMTAIDAAERRGQIGAERQERTATAEARPSDVAARFLALYASPRTEDAWNGFHDLAKDFGGSALGHVGMARVYLDWNTLDQADAEFAKALAAEPKSWIVLRLRGEAQERRQRFAEARADYQAVLEADPQCPEARVGLARILRQAGDAAGARREAEAALAVAPSDPPALALLSDLALEAGDKKGAAELLARAVEASPRDRERRVTLAKLLADRGDARAALDQWQAALAQREDTETLHAVAEQAHLALDRRAERRALERLNQLEPGVAGSWRRLAELDAAAGDADGAEAAWRQVIAREPQDAPAHAALGRLLVQRGDVAAAVAEYRAAGGASAAERAALEKQLSIEPVSRKRIDDLQRVVQGLIDRTYRSRLEQSPGLAGTLTLRVAVDIAGAASSVDTVEDSVHDEQVRACAYWNLRDATYPQNKPGRYSFTFKLRPRR